MDFDAEIARASDLIAGGGVVAIPTDTLYGLAADATNPEAVEKVFDIKGRPFDMALPVLVSSWDQVDQVALVDGPVGEVAERLAIKFWPGSLTLVLPVKAAVPYRLTAGRDTIAVRMPNHRVPLALASRLRTPITGTSANASGQADIAGVDELRRSLGRLVDGIITLGPDPLGIASTIVAVSHNGVELIRPGALLFDDIRNYLENG